MSSANVSPVPLRARKLVALSKSHKFREVTRVVEFDVPTPGPRQVLIRVEYAGVNASDINYTAGLYIPKMKYPADTGFEAVGVVMAVGSQVNTANVNDTVLVTTYGAFSEYLLSPARNVIVLGQGVRVDRNLLTLPVSGLTASIALEEVGQIRRGETLLVTAAAGGTGLFAVQLGVLAGMHVIGTCSSESKVDVLRRLGCHRVINYKTERLDDVLQKEYPKGINVVYESVGGETFDICVKHLAVRGRLIVIGMVSGYQDQSAWKTNSAYTRPLPSLILGKSASIRGFFLNNFAELQQQHFVRLLQLYQTGKLQLLVDGAPFCGLESVSDAIDYMYTGKNVGKVVVTIGEASQAQTRTNSKLKSKL